MIEQKRKKETIKSFFLKNKLSWMTSSGIFCGTNFREWLLLIFSRDQIFAILSKIRENAIL